MGREKNLLLIDDDADLRQTLEEQISFHDEFRTTSFGDAHSALDYIKDNHVDIILLDIELPDMDGRELCNLLRQQHCNMPILMLTGSDGEADTILGLNSGANDYIVKPFSFGVLLARLRAHLRQHEQNESASFRIGPLYFPHRHKTALRRQGQENSPHRKGSGDFEISLSHRQPASFARSSVE